jgi:hypothetical protein
MCLTCPGAGAELRSGSKVRRSRGDWRLAEGARVQCLSAYVNIPVKPKFT